jgi:LysR family transcriptional regulator, hydrogen peroxide-inducible genes activator
MNLQQLEYIIAVDTHRHFVTASEKCFVTQATLSMMIKKLEEELDAKIFDRSKHPVIPTEVGSRVIAQAKVILAETARLKEIVSGEHNLMHGELRIGIIPTLAPYLIPLFLSGFLKNYPFIKLQMHELTTSEITSRLKQNELDAGVLAIPLHDKDLVEEGLFTEEFVVYAATDTLKEKAFKNKYIIPSDLDIQKLWLLEEGHCLRDQVINLCELKLHEKNVHQFDLSAASIETIRKIVDMNQGITVLPALAIQDLPDEKKSHIRYFRAPSPVRKIGLVSFRYFVKEKMLQALKTEICNSVPAEMKSEKNKQVIEL